MCVCVFAAAISTTATVAAAVDGAPVTFFITKFSNTYLMKIYTIRFFFFFFFLHLNNFIFLQNVFGSIHVWFLCLMAYQSLWFI